ncbi:zinc finger protein 575 isoform X3 [Arvicola amphibius]|uniref:zinc finger protein 575 isoform X3 n=1 Tax=Arvicola amphibius TaxID=1047088 RepID=UPI001C0A1860|nr:zinc finger protein 575 isoform X3 [Arvicola amphibius]
MKVRLGPAACRASSFPLSFPRAASPSAHRAVQIRGLQGSTQGLAETGGFRSPTPGERPPCRSPYPTRFPVLHQGCDLATRRTGWTQHPWTETKGRAPTHVSVNLVITGVTPTLLTATPEFLCQQDAGWKCEIRGHLPGPGDPRR